MSVDFFQFRDLVVLPVCQAFPRPEEAATLLMRIAAHESLGCTYLRQKVDGGYGRGRGPWQMEPATVTLLVTKLTRVRFHYPMTTETFARLELKSAGGRADILQWDFRVAATLARMLLFASKWPMPDEEDIDQAYRVYVDVWRPGKPPTFGTFVERYISWRRGEL